MTLKSFFLSELSRLTSVPVKDLDEERLRQLRQETPSKAVIRDQREHIGGYYNSSGLRKLVTLEEIEKRREKVQKWLASH